MDRAGGEETVELEGVDACGAVEPSVLGEDVGDLIGGLPADFAGGDVGFGEFGFEEGPEEQQDGGMVVHAGQVSCR